MHARRTLFAPCEKSLKSTIFSSRLNIYGAIRLIPDKSLYSIPQRLDAYISGAAIKNRYLRAPRKIRSKKAWERAARILAYGVHNTLMYWSPDIVVIGGSMMNEPNGISIERVRVHLKQTVKIFPEIPPVEKATLGDKAGLYGALALIGQR